MHTLDQQTELKQAARKRINDSRALDGDVGRLAHFFRGWASSYDLDVGREGYCGPTLVAGLAGTMQPTYLASQRPAITILDAGCGTGALGVQLERLGFHSVDWFDLSEEMVEKASTAMSKAMSTLTGRYPTTPLRLVTLRSAAASSPSGTSDRMRCANWLASRAPTDSSSQAPARAMRRPLPLKMRRGVCKLRAYL
ncbi:methyltransferase domain-containing protein [Mesorhizobium sp. M1409]